MKSVPKHTPHEITELLESDDELPDCYVETASIPAYQDDYRFNKEQHKSNELCLTREQLCSQATFICQSYKEQPIEQLSTNCTISSEVQIIKQNVLPDKSNNKKILISKGVLSKRDIYLVKSIEEYATDTTLVWFINFLNNNTEKPLQRSCLVADMTDNYIATKEPFTDLKRYYFKLVVK